MQHWIDLALKLGFSHACSLHISSLQPRADIRAMCAADQCGAYGKTWTCPPHCGTLEECASTIQRYRHGLLLQTVGTLEKTIDTKAYRRTEEAHLSRLSELLAHIRQADPDALCLGAGGCRICKRCAYPAPCRFPAQAMSSMEGYGLFVTQVCRDNGMAYHHGEKTITFTGCILFNPECLNKGNS